jgi:hypothetical protein
MGLGIALISYDGKVCWGFNADYELAPDLPAIVELVRQSFAELKNAVTVRPVDVARTEAPEAEPSASAARARGAGAAS